MSVRTQTNGNPHTLLMECKIVQPLGKTVWQFIKMSNLQLPYDWAIPHIGMNPKEIKTYIPSKTCTWMLLAATFHSGPEMKLKYPWTGEWINNVTYPHEETPISKKRKELTHATTWLGLKTSMLSERRRSQKRSHIVWWQLYSMSRKGKSKETGSRLVASWNQD